MCFDDLKGIQGCLPLGACPGVRCQVRELAQRQEPYLAGTGSWLGGDNQS